MSSDQRESSKREAPLKAEIARLHQLLQEASVSARTAASQATADAATARKKAASTKIRHARELADERALTASARSDVRRAVIKTAANAATARKKARETEARHIRELTDERELTSAALGNARELHHRIKNTFAIVQAIANSSLRPDISYDDARVAFHSRLSALAHVQDLLFQKNWKDATLKSVVDSIVAPQLGNSSGRFRVRGPGIGVGPKTALMFGLALNELITNALKYGALSNAAGYVEVVWTRKPEFRLRWHERNGPPVTAPNRNGFGSRLIRESVAAQLHGTVEVDFDRRGLICMIRAPVHELLA